MDEVQHPCNPQCHTPLSLPFRLYLILVYSPQEPFTIYAMKMLVLRLGVAEQFNRIATILEPISILSPSALHKAKCCTCRDVSCIQVDCIQQGLIDCLDTIQSYWKYWRTRTTICFVQDVNNSAARSGNALEMSILSVVSQHGREAISTKQNGETNSPS
jgi:hypothetical protein